MKLLGTGLAALTALAVVGATTAAAIFSFSYYRWESAPTTECDVTGEGVEVRTGNQPREWALLDSEHRARNHYFTNGAEFLGQIFDPPDGSGSQTYAPFHGDADAFPFHYVLRIATLSGSASIYQSALAATCTGVGSTTSVIVNWIPGIEPKYYRHGPAPPVECTTNGDHVELRFDSQPFEFKNVPADAVYNIVRLKNGVESLTGPFDPPDGDGADAFGQFATSAPAYPIHYATRYDTVIDGNVVYQSVRLGSCTANGPGTSRVYNVPEPDGATLALGALGAGVGVAARRRRKRASVRV